MFCSNLITYVLFIISYCEQIKFEIMYISYLKIKVVQESYIKREKKNS